MTTEEIDTPNCKGCLNKIDEGAVVSFGDSLFHVKCFNCAKCGQSVDNKANLLLLEDGRPVCDNCSYNCAACHKAIQDEAIMTGSKAYHGNCFQCIACKKTIEDLIFTQTAKGIYCTACYDLRKAEKQKRKNKSKPIETQALPTPIRSRSNSLKKSKLTATESTTSLFSDFTLDFFDNESSELANLSDSLGVNLSLNLDQDKNTTTQSRLNRASEILQSSLRSSTIVQPSSPSFIPPSSSDINKLKQELAESQSRLKELETSYKSLQDASQQALNEFKSLQQDFARESSIQKQQELTIVSLLQKNGGVLSRKEIDRVAMLRVELERTCVEIINYRDKIASSIDESPLLANYQKSLKTQIKSLVQERDLLQTQTKSLRATRDQVIHDIVKHNAQEESIIVTSPTSDSPPLSPSQSSDNASLLSTRPRKESDASSILCRVSSRGSFISDQKPTLLRLKKKGSAMFSRWKEPKSKQEGIYGNSLFNSSLQSLSSVSTHEGGSWGRSSAKEKGFIDSSASLHMVSSNNSSMSLSEHAFQPMSFIRPVKCGVCGDKIWSRSEYRCECCGFCLHTRCLNKAPQQCPGSNSTFDLSLDMQPSVSSSSLQSNIDTKKSLPENSMFGCDLVQRVQLENRSTPLVVEECIKEVEKRGLDFEGIYRKSGGAAQIRAIQLAFDQGEHINLSDEDEYNDIGAITSVLKQYFRELPDPLFTFALYDTLIDISSMRHDEHKIEAMKNALSRLPKEHYNTIAMLFRHLYRVFQHADQNRMSIKNLAMVFAPTLMRHNDPSRDFLDISYKNATIEYILLHLSELIPEH